MAKRPEVLHECRIVSYDSQHWRILKELREEALRIMDSLEGAGISSRVYGSVARGDIHSSSDIDIFIPSKVASYKIELALDRIVRRELVQATPSSVLKGHIHVGKKTVVTFPLFKMMSREEEFYKWGGLLDISSLKQGERVLGVDKRLILIRPTESGHVESGVIGYEHQVARKLGVSIDIAMERVRVLTRRDEVGRTGVYLNKTIPEDSNFEEQARLLINRNPALRRTYERRTG